MNLRKSLGRLLAVLVLSMPIAATGQLREVVINVYGMT